MISEKGLNLIKKFEGFSSVVFFDNGVPCIGYGCDLLVSDEVEFYRAHSPITESDATALLLNRLQGVERTLIETGLVFSQNQFDALCSFIYNVGRGAFLNSTLLALLKAGNIEDAADQFLVWDKVNGITNSGLAARRAEERELFLASD